MPSGRRERKYHHHHHNPSHSSPSDHTLPKKNSPSTTHDITKSFVIGLKKGKKDHTCMHAFVCSFAAKIVLLLLFFHDDSRGFYQ